MKQRISFPLDLFMRQ